MGKKRGKPYTRSVLRADGGPSPDEGGRSDVLASERASATPIARVEKRRAAPAESADRSKVEGPLDLLQAWFTEVVTHPKSAEAGVAAAGPIAEALGAEHVESIVLPNDRLTAVERLGLYHYAYHARLVECLADDYPTIRYAIGGDTFEKLAKAYVTAHPSSHPNLNFFGGRFPAFVREQPWLDNAHFLSDLGRLEWAMVEVLHAKAEEAISLAGLEAAGPERWAEIRLSASPTLRFLELDFPVNAFLQRYREDAEPPIPARAWSATAVYRQGFSVWRMGFTKPMAGVLAALLAGRTLGEALEPLDLEDTSEGDVMVWFREWIAGGFFSALSF
jgi:hypothetical protein